MDADIVVIGGGPAGLVAGIEAKKSGAEKVVILEREDELGGILKQCIHNGFGTLLFHKDLTGPEYAENLIEEVKKENVEYFLNTMVTDITKDKTITAISPERGVFEIRAKSVVLAMGCRERARGNLLIPGTRPAGVFTAGVAQRFINIDGFLPGKEVVILGSGDIGLIMARRFTLEGAKVKGVYEIMNEPGGLKRNIVQCLNDFGIPLHLSHTVTKIHGKERVEGVTVAQVDKNRNIIKGTEKFVKCDTLLLSVGLIPENELTKKAEIEMSAITKGPVCSETMETSVPGIFASGNVSAVFDLADYVAETGKIAGKSAALFASGNLRKRKGINLIPGKNVRIVFPQKFTFNSDLVLFVRVSKRFDKPVFVRLSPCGIRKRQLYARPAEMIRIEIPKEKLINLQGDITISVEEAN
ncbi:MAG: FAD-dependent oxidoreductase [Caldisericaceae bacterium]|nr:FAD-dependent oxidoreductase [Caldisericaceae bacterium]